MQSCLTCKFGFRFRTHILYCEFINGFVDDDLWENPELHCDFYRKWKYDNLDGNSAKRRSE